MAIIMNFDEIRSLFVTKLQSSSLAQQCDIRAEYSGKTVSLPVKNPLISVGVDSLRTERLTLDGNPGSCAGKVTAVLLFTVYLPPESAGQLCGEIVGLVCDLLYAEEFPPLTYTDISAGKIEYDPKTNGCKMQIKVTARGAAVISL